MLFISFGTSKKGKKASELARLANSPELKPQLLLFCEVQTTVLVASIGAPGALRKVLLPSKMDVAASTELSAKEAEIYDRQIRLWGVDAQRRMRGSRVLLAGFRALNAELCKNLVLAGIGVTIQDDGVVSQPDLASAVCITEGCPRCPRCAAGGCNYGVVLASCLYG